MVSLVRFVKGFQMKYQKGFTAIEMMIALMVPLMIAGAVGWVMNIIDIFGMEQIFTGMGILRIIGVFVAPLGAVLGYF
jgi:prepilin-type N-terminal cleavage/methylation domain-containing protein